MTGAHRWADGAAAAGAGPGRLGHRMALTVRRAGPTMFLIGLCHAIGDSADLSLPACSRGEVGVPLVAPGES